MLCIPTIELLKEKPIENHGNGGIEKTKRMTLPRNGKEKKGVCKNQKQFTILNWSPPSLSKVTPYYI